MDNHNLIPRDQTFVTNRKLLSVHSEDRNLAFWPESNTFAITLPAPILNVQSIRLIQSTFPSSLYVFSENQGNTKFNITIGGSQTATPIEIHEGTYTEEDFVTELNTVLHSNVDASGVDVSWSSIDGKLTFTSDASFNLDFTKRIYYNGCGPNFALANNIEGLPYHMGFENENYTSSLDVDGSENIVSSFPINIIGESCFYMEVDKYNLLDELSPYNNSIKDSSCVILEKPRPKPYNLNCLDHKDHLGPGRRIIYNPKDVPIGKSNSAFAKIPLTINPALNPYFNSQFITLCNAGFYDPPIEKISTLRFKFRYHNGALVDFKNKRFDFTLEFTSLRNEISKTFSVRKGVI